VNRIQVERSNEDTAKGEMDFRRRPLTSGGAKKSGASTVATSQPELSTPATKETELEPELKTNDPSSVQKEFCIGVEAHPSCLVMVRGADHSLRYRQDMSMDKRDAAGRAESRAILLEVADLMLGFLKRCSRRK
jgi:hypothetical protein